MISSKARASPIVPRAEKGRDMATSRKATHDEFARRAEQVFAQHGDPVEKALLDAEMMWLAWRGDDKYLEVYLGDQAGRQSSWQFCEYNDIPEMIRHYKYVEVRPMYPPFADHILAFLVVLLQREVGRNPGANVYSRSIDSNVLGFVERKVDCARAYDVVKGGSEVVVDWIRQPGDVLKTRSMSVSADHFSSSDYTRTGDKTPLNSRGFIYIFKKQDRLAAKRKRRQSAVRWVMSG